MKPPQVDMVDDDQETSKLQSCNEYEIKDSFRLKMPCETIGDLALALQSIDRRLQIVEHVLINGNVNVDVSGDITIAKSDDSVLNLLADRVTAMIGLREVIVSKSWVVKVLWLLIFIAGTAATVYYLEKTIAEYSEHPVATTIKLSNEEAEERPVLKLCIDEWRDPDKIAAAGLSGDALDYITGYFNFDTDFRTSKVDKARSEFETFFRRQNFTHLMDFLHYMAYDIGKDVEETATHIRTESGLNGSKIAFDGYGWDSEFGIRKVLTFDRGICYQFRQRLSNEEVDPMQLQHVMSLSVIMPETAGRLDRTDYWTMYVQSESDALYTSPDDSCAILHGMLNMVTISRKTFRKLNTEDRPCDEDSAPLFNCVLKCLDEPLRRAVNCSLVFFAERRTDIGTYCNSRHLDEFFRENYDVSNHMQDSARLCSQRCRNSCSTVVHHLTVQSVDKNLNTNQSYAGLRIIDASNRWHGMLLFEEHFTYSFDSLVGNVGGTLGLFLGATVLTFFQVVLTLIEYTVTAKKQRSR